MVIICRNDGSEIEVTLMDVILGRRATIRRPKRQSTVLSPAEVLKKAEEPKAAEKKAEMLATEAKKKDEHWEWTAEEDAILIGMKAQNKPWQEIGALLKGKAPFMRDRYEQLVKDAMNKEAKDSNTKSYGWTANEDAILIGMKTLDMAWEEIAVALKGKAPFMKYRYEYLVKAVADRQAEAKKAEYMKYRAEKEKEAKANEGKGKEKERDVEKNTQHNKRPVFYLDEAGGLTPRETMTLYHLHKCYDQEKWAGIASRFYKKTGKRLNVADLPALVGEKFAFVNV